MSSGMFRGKESSNRIELSRLVQDLLNFGVLGSLQLWGWGVDGWGWGWLGGPPLTCTCTHAHTCTCMCMHAHTCTHMHAHARVLNMIISCKWPSSLGESLGIPYDVICVCGFMHVHACVCMYTCVGAPSHHPPPPSTHPPTPQGGPSESVKIQYT